MHTSPYGKKGHYFLEFFHPFLRFFPLQVIKFNTQGETWVEKGPYCPPLPEEEPEITREEEKEGQSNVPEVAVPAIVEAPMDSPVSRRDLKVSFSQEEPFRKRTSALVDDSRKMSYPFLSRSMSVCHPARPVAVSNSFVCPSLFSCHEYGK